jgi:hypothetical protein
MGMKGGKGSGNSNSGYAAVYRREQAHFRVLI